MNKRRELIKALGAGALLPVAALAQVKRRPVIIGWLSPASVSTNTWALTAFREGMTAAGWREGADFVIEQRWAEAHPDRVQALAEELARKNPDVFVTHVPSAAALLPTAAPQTPIVQASGGDLVAFGLARSLAKPGGMVTGVTSLVGELTGKLVELLMEL